MKKKDHYLPVQNYAKWSC